jgi:hypothetical protein
MDQPSDKDILSKEIKSLELFEYALREENRFLFSNMLSECVEKTMKRQCGVIPLLNKLEHKALMMDICLCHQYHL